MSEAVRYIVNVQAVIVHEGRYLVIVRSMKEAHAGGTLSFVGGKVDDIHPVDDVLEVSIRREIMEEVGVTVGDLTYLESVHFTGSDNRDPVVNIVFLCPYVAGDAHVVSPDEVESVLWLTADELLAHPALPPWTLRTFTKAEALRVKLGY